LNYLYYDWSVIDLTNIKILLGSLFLVDVENIIYIDFNKNYFINKVVKYFCQLLLFMAQY